MRRHTSIANNCKTESVVSKLDLTVACETTHIMLQCSTSTSINPYYPMNITRKTRSGESKDGHGATNIDQQREPIKMHGDHGRDSIDSAALRTTSPKCFTVQDSTSSSGEASQPSAGHAPLITVSPRKLNKFRDTTGSFHWFRSEGNDPLSFPPSHIEDVAEGDLLFYWVKSAGKCQMWIWRSVGGMTAWVPVREGEQILGGDAYIQPSSNPKSLYVADLTAYSSNTLSVRSRGEKRNESLTSIHIDSTCANTSAHILLQRALNDVTIWQHLEYQYARTIMNSPPVPSTRIIPSTLMYAWDFHEGHKGPCFGMARPTRVSFGT
ncbi:hypothetical protein EDC04DRAFT_2613143 [Pisolithus marmoratus]|nr:hypothetical protein EDC04DRAFT_2613143 [Pisolithus marmoratus]